MIGQFRTKRYVVSDGGGKYLGHDYASGGYPWVSTSLHNATFYDNLEKALEGIDDFLGHYCRMPSAGVYQIILDQVDMTDEIEKIEVRKREEELARIKKNVANLRPEDIAYIKANM